MFHGPAPAPVARGPAGKGNVFEMPWGGLAGPSFSSSLSGLACSPFTVVTNFARSLVTLRSPVYHAHYYTPSVASISRSTHPLSPSLFFFFRRLLTPINRRHVGQIRPCFLLPRSLRRCRGLASCMSPRGSQVCSFSAQCVWVRWSRCWANRSFNSAEGHPADFDSLCGSRSDNTQKEIVNKCGKDTKEALSSYKQSCGEAGYKISMCIPRHHTTTLPLRSSTVSEEN